MKNKNRLNRLNKGYIKIPDDIFDMELGPEIIGLFCYLAKQTEDFNPSVRTIGKALRISITSVCKYLKVLQSSNIIRLVKSHSIASPTEYEFIDPKDWLYPSFVGKNGE